MVNKGGTGTMRRGKIEERQRGNLILSRNWTCSLYLYRGDVLLRRSSGENTSFLLNSLERSRFDYHSPIICRYYLSKTKAAN